jgi:large subunit ribosomal protein L29
LVRRDGGGSDGRRAAWPVGRRARDQAAEAKEELFNLRFQSATGQLDNNKRLQTVKHDIARIYTVMRERELGLTSEPAASTSEA